MSKRSDLTGQFFGSLEAVRRVDPINGVSRWDVWCHKCNSGLKTVNQRDLQSQRYTTCGCGKKKDIKGQKFGRLIALGRSEPVNGRSMWTVQCNCERNTVKVVSQSSLVRGCTTSCGCAKQEQARSAIKVLQQAGRDEFEHSLKGKRFGHCVVGNRSRFEKGQSIWECLCDCGIAFEAKGARLAFGNKKSCGCKNGLSPDRTMRNELFKSYTNSAAKRGLSWELSDAEFDRLTKEDCSYCGIPPASVWKRAKRRGAYEYNGLDRVS